jgi:hypothetical protein
MAGEKIEELDLTKVAASKPQREPGPKVKEVDPATKSAGQKPAPSVSLKDAPLPKR